MNQFIESLRGFSCFGLTEVERGMSGSKIVADTSSWRAQRRNTKAMRRRFDGVQRAACFSSAGSSWTRMRILGVACVCVSDIVSWVEHSLADCVSVGVRIVAWVGQRQGEPKSNSARCGIWIGMGLAILVFPWPASADSLSRIGFYSRPEPPESPEAIEKNPWRISDPGAWINWKAVDQPWRIVDGATNYVPRAEAWYHCHARVIQVVDNRLLVSMSFNRPGQTNGLSFDEVTAFLKNYPRRAIDGDKLPPLVAKLVGTNDYQTVLGDRNTVRVFDFGIPCTAPVLKRPAQKP